MKKFKNKGFTLVELIVVIAIIGVLAAILVPTLVNYTVRAHVTSANNTAASLEKSIDNFMLESDIKGQGMHNVDSAECEIEIVVTNSQWTITVSDVSVFHTKALPWNGTGSGNRSTPVAAATCAEEEMAAVLAGQYPELETAYIKCHVKSGDCNALYYTDETDSPVTAPTFASHGWSADTFSWDNNNAGISPDGIVVGTSPAVELA